MAGWIAYNGPAIEAVCVAEPTGYNLSSALSKNRDKQIASISMLLVVVHYQVNKSISVWVSSISCPTFVGDG
jgi:hypothetical protein